MKQNKQFDCPACGNPLQESKKPVIRCPYCETIIVPQNSKSKRKASVYVKKSNG